MVNPIVSGEILFPNDSFLQDSAVGYIHLLDVSLADAPSFIVAEEVIEDIAERILKGETIKFALYGEIKNPRASYTVSVHIDLDGDGRVGRGDYINMQSYPVITFGHPNVIKMKVVKVL